MAIWKRPAPNSNRFVSLGNMKVHAEQAGYLTNGDSVLAALLLGLKVKAPDGWTGDGWGKGHAMVALPKVANGEGVEDSRASRWAVPGALDAYKAWAEAECVRDIARAWVTGDVLRPSPA